jgi:hypothetical protein
MWSEIAATVLYNLLEFIFLYMGWGMQEKRLVLTTEDLSAALREVGTLEPSCLL